MKPSHSPVTGISKTRRILATFFGAAVLAAGAHVAAQGPVAGRNVNMVGGPVDVKFAPAFELKEGDPFGQRQNDVSCAADSRNPLVIFCSAND